MRVGEKKKRELKMRAISLRLRPRAVAQAKQRALESNLSLVGYIEKLIERDVRHDRDMKRPTTC
jgi:predicted HicB family RNase H-like nuclease